MAARILVVDDEKGLTDVLSDLLDMEGYQTQVCHDAVSARQALAVGKFDVAMLDVFLTNEPIGLDLAKHIFAEYPQTAVILMTGYADKADVEHACLSGVYTCIAKPFNLNDVLNVIEIVLDSATITGGEK